MFFFSKEFFICNFPFIFDSQAKTLLLQLDQAIQMQNAVIQATSQAAFQVNRYSFTFLVSDKNMQVLGIFPG